MKSLHGSPLASAHGLGKTYIGAALLKTLQRVYHQQALFICPKRLERMWQTFNDHYALGATVISMSLLRSGNGGHRSLDLVSRFPNHRVVLVDESHNFRHSDTQRYRLLQPYLHRPGTKAILVTATPRNTSARDVMNQLLLWMEDDAGTVPITPVSLSAYFRRIEETEYRERETGVRVSGPHLPDVLRLVMVRRTRSHIQRYYPNANINGKPVLFPERDLKTVDYRIDAVYGSVALYRRLVNDIEAMKYARYGLFNYVRPELRREPRHQNLQRAGSRLRGLMKAMLLKRLESSVAAFRATVERLERSHARFLALMDEGKVPAGEEAADILMAADDEEFAELQEELQASGQLLDLASFSDSLRDDIEADRRTYRLMLDLVSGITPDKDAKLQTLLKRLTSEAELRGKVLLFTQFKDTADYLRDELEGAFAGKRVVEWMTSDREDQLGVIGRFSPKSNPDATRWVRAGDPSIDILVTTDVLSEGLNLQDFGAVVNYDIHWNPVRLIQRVGRIDRIGVGYLEHPVVWGFNFLPDEGLDHDLNLRETVRRRIQEIHDTIGEDAKVLEENERLNTADLYSIYVEGRLPEEEEDDLFSIQEAVEILRRIRDQEPELFAKLTSMSNGVRASRTARKVAGRSEASDEPTDLGYSLDPAKSEP